MPSDNNRSPRKAKGQRQKNNNKKNSHNKPSPKKQSDQHQRARVIPANDKENKNVNNAPPTQSKSQVPPESNHVVMSNQTEQLETEIGSGGEMSLGAIRDSNSNQQQAIRSPAKSDNALTEALNTIDLMLKNPTLLNASIAPSKDREFCSNPNKEQTIIGKYDPSKGIVVNNEALNDTMKIDGEAAASISVRHPTVSSNYRAALINNQKVISKIEIDDDLEEVDIADAEDDDDIAKSRSSNSESDLSDCKLDQLPSYDLSGQVNLGYRTDDASSSSPSSSPTPIESSTSNRSSRTLSGSITDQVSKGKHVNNVNEVLSRSKMVDNEDNNGRRASHSAIYRVAQRDQNEPRSLGSMASTSRQSDQAIKLHDDVKKRLELRVQAQDDQIRMLLDQALQQADKMSSLETALISTNRTCHQLESMLKQELAKRSTLESDSRDLMNEVSKLRGQLEASEQIKMRDDERISLLNATLMERETEVSILKLKLTRATTSIPAAMMGNNSSRPTSQSSAVHTGYQSSNGTNLYGSMRGHRPPLGTDSVPSSPQRRIEAPATSFSQHSTPIKRLPARRIDAFDSFVSQSSTTTAATTSTTSTAPVTATSAGTNCPTIDTTVLTSSPLTRDRRYRTLPRTMPSSRMQETIDHDYHENQLTGKPIANERIYNNIDETDVRSSSSNKLMGNNDNHVSHNEQSKVVIVDTSNYSRSRPHRSHSTVGTVVSSSNNSPAANGHYRITDLDDSKSPVTIEPKKLSTGAESSDDQSSKLSSKVESHYDVVVPMTDSTNNYSNSTNHSTSTNNNDSNANEPASHYATLITDSGPSASYPMHARPPVPTTPVRQTSGLKRIFAKLRRTGSRAPESDEEDVTNQEIHFRRAGMGRNTVNLGSGGSGAINAMHQQQHRPMINSSKPFAEWDTNQIAEWMTRIGLSMYSNQCKRWVKSGSHLMNATLSEVERGLGITNSLHRKKLRLAISEANDDCDKITKAAASLDYLWVARWLDDIGLSQYRETFINARIDGRVLNYLTIEDLTSMDITSVLHHASIRCGIRVLRSINFDLQLLRRRATAAEIESMNCRTTSTGSLPRGKSGSLSSATEASASNSLGTSDMALWTCHRVMEWLRLIELSEFAPNLRGSGVHGGLIVYEDGFNADLMSTLLSVPDDKTLIRRHIYTLFKELIGPELSQQKRQHESMPNYMPLSPTAELKTTRRSQFSSLLRRKSSKVGQNNLDVQYLCPMYPMDPKFLQAAKANRAAELQQHQQQQQQQQSGIESTATNV